MSLVLTIKKQLNHNPFNVTRMRRAQRKVASMYNVFHTEKSLEWSSILKLKDVKIMVIKQNFFSFKFLFFKTFISLHTTVFTMLFDLFL